MTFSRTTIIIVAVNRFDKSIPAHTVTASQDIPTRLPRTGTGVSEASGVHTWGGVRVLTPSRTKKQKIGNTRSVIRTFHEMIEN